MRLRTWLRLRLRRRGPRLHLRHGYRLKEPAPAAPEFFHTFGSENFRVHARSAAMIGRLHLSIGFE